MSLALEDRMTHKSQDVAACRDIPIETTKMSLPITLNQLMTLEARLRIERQQGENARSPEKKTNIIEVEKINETNKVKTSFYSFSMYQYL